MKAPATAGKRQYLKLTDVTPVAVPNVGNFRANRTSIQMYNDANGSWTPFDKDMFIDVIQQRPDAFKAINVSSMKEFRDFILSTQVEANTSVSAASEIPYTPRKQVQANVVDEKEGVGFRLKKIGKGISIEREPTYAEFGKYVIHVGQLKNNDILNVKYKSLGNIPQFKSVPVSDVFKDFILDVLETGKANSRVYDNVPPDERKLFERIASGAGVFQTIKLKKR